MSIWLGIRTMGTVNVNLSSEILILVTDMAFSLLQPGFVLQIKL